MWNGLRETMLCESKYVTAKILTAYELCLWTTNRTVFDFVCRWAGRGLKRVGRERLGGTLGYEHEWRPRSKEARPRVVRLGGRGLKGWGLGRGVRRVARRWLWAEKGQQWDPRPRGLGCNLAVGWKVSKGARPRALFAINQLQNTLSSPPQIAKRVEAVSLIR